MRQLWDFRLFLGLFLPSILIGTVSFFQGIVSCFSLLWSGGVALLCLFFLQFLPSTRERIRFYLFLFPFCLLVYLPYPLLSGGGYPFASWRFWVYLSSVFPTIPFVFALEKQESKISKYGRDFFFFLIFLCGVFLLISFLREFLDFQEFRFWQGPKGVISLKIFLQKIGLSTLTNTFFTSPSGGMALVGLMGAIFYGKLRKKYES